MCLATGAASVGGTFIPSGSEQRARELAAGLTITL